jgi:hypothetical protein
MWLLSYVVPPFSISLYQHLGPLSSQLLGLTHCLCSPGCCCSMWAGFLLALVIVEFSSKQRRGHDTEQMPVELCFQWFLNIPLLKEQGPPNDSLKAFHAGLWESSTLAMPYHHVFWLTQGIFPVSVSKDKVLPHAVHCVMTCLICHCLANTAAMGVITAMRLYCHFHCIALYSLDMVDNLIFGNHRDHSVIAIAPAGHCCASAKSHTIWAQCFCQALSLLLNLLLSPVPPGATTSEPSHLPSSLCGDFFFSQRSRSELVLPLHWRVSNFTYNHLSSKV